jgi:hypothetical protein
MSKDLGRGRLGSPPGTAPDDAPGVSRSAAGGRLGFDPEVDASTDVVRLAGTEPAREPETNGVGWTAQGAQPPASPGTGIGSPSPIDWAAPTQKPGPAAGSRAGDVEPGAGGERLVAAPAGHGSAGWAAPGGPGSDAARSLPQLSGPIGPPPPDRPSPPMLGRPGGIPLRPLDVGDILDGTFGTIRRNPRAVIGLSALLVTVQEVLAVGAQIGTGDVPTAFGVLPGQASLQLVGGIGAVLSLVLSTVVSAVLTGMIAVVVSEDIFGRRVTAGDVWRRVRARIWALAGASLIAGLLPFAGLLFLLVPGGVPVAVVTLAVPGAIFWASLSLTTPALMLERLGPIRALRRSWRLAFRGFWRVWGIRTLSVLLGWVMQGLLLIPFAALGALLAYALGAQSDDRLPLIAVASVVLGSILGGIIAQPFLAGVLALLYVDRRMRAEGLDIVIQQRARASRRMGSAVSAHAAGSRPADLPSAGPAAPTGGWP